MIADYRDINLSNLLYPIDSPFERHKLDFVTAYDFESTHDRNTINNYSFNPNVVNIAGGTAGAVVTGSSGERVEVIPHKISLYDSDGNESNRWNVDDLNMGSGTLSFEDSDGTVGVMIHGNSINTNASNHGPGSVVTGNLNMDFNNGHGIIRNVRRIIWNFTSTTAGTISNGTSFLRYDSDSSHVMYVNDDETLRISDDIIWARNIDSVTLDPATDLTVRNSSGGNIFKVTTSSGSVRVTGNFEVTGTKNFYMQHPDGKFGKMLRYASDESPEVAVNCRGYGTLDENGFVSIQPPKHFSQVTEPEGLVTVGLTPIGNYQPYLMDIPKNDRFAVGGTPSGIFSWEMKAVRLGGLDFEPETYDKKAWEDIEKVKNKVETK